MAWQNERAVIGSLLFDGRCLPDVEKTGLTAEDFEVAEYRLAFEAILDSEPDANGWFDPYGIGGKMAARQGGDYHDLMEEAMKSTPTANNAGLYAALVKEDSNRRRVKTLLDNAQTAAAFGNLNEVTAIIDSVNDLLATDSGLASGEDLSNDFLSYFEMVKKDPRAAYCETGFADLDRQFGGGMFKSEVYIIGARPGMGKTTLGINIAQNIVNRGGAVLFISLEMSKQQIEAKRIALETSIRYTDLMAGRISGGEEAQMHDWIIGNRDRPFFLVTKPVTVSEIGRYAKQVKNLACVIVDYIGLVSCPEESRQKPRYEQMTEISAALKSTAKALQVPILALCQLNRENTTRADKRPTMADLRDSGAIEQDAGAIVLLHRPDYYIAKESGETPEIEEIELNVAKNRHAETGMVRMWWHGNIGKISMQARSAKEEELPF